MSRLSTGLKVAICAILLIALTALLAPAITNMMSAYAAAAASGNSTDNSGETGLDIPFLAQLASTDYYGLYGTKTVSGQSGSYGMTFALTVRGDDFALKTDRQDHSYRQLYMDGQYILVDDTAETIQKDVLEFDFPDKNLIESIDGKVLRSAGEIINGTQVTRVEIYKDGTVYAYYFNKQGILIRFYYIYEGNEVTLDFEKALIGDSCCATFDMPSTYTVF